MRTLVAFAALAAVSMLAACASTPEQAMGRTLENAGSVVRGAGDEVLPGQTVEDSAGKALENAGDAVSDTADKSGNKLWGTPEKRPQKKR